jgi:hypothetical protein
LNACDRFAIEIRAATSSANRKLGPETPSDANIPVSLRQPIGLQPQQSRLAVGNPPILSASSRTSTEGEGFEPSMDETAHTGFRDRDPLDVDSDAVQGCRDPSFGWCDRYAIETEFLGGWTMLGEGRFRIAMGLRRQAPRDPRGEAPLVAEARRAGACRTRRLPMQSRRRRSSTAGPPRGSGLGSLRSRPPRPIQQ